MLGIAMCLHKPACYLFHILYLFIAFTICLLTACFPDLPYCCTSLLLALLRFDSFCCPLCNNVKGLCLTALCSWQIFRRFDLLLVLSIRQCWIIRSRTRGPELERRVVSTTPRHNLQVFLRIMLAEQGLFSGIFLDRKYNSHNMAYAVKLLPGIFPS